MSYNEINEKIAQTESVIKGTKEQIRDIEKARKACTDYLDKYGFQYDEESIPFGSALMWAREALEAHKQTLAKLKKAAKLASQLEELTA